MVTASHLCAGNGGGTPMLRCGSSGKHRFAPLADNRGVNSDRISSPLRLQPLRVRLDSEEIAVLQLRQRIGHRIGKLSVCINHKWRRDFIYRLLLIVCH